MEVRGSSSSADLTWFFRALDQSVICSTSLSSPKGQYLVKRTSAWSSMKSIFIRNHGLIVNITVLKRPCSKLWTTCVLLKMNWQHVTLMVPLDLSTAFDTVDHNILLELLRRDVGIGGKVLHWFSSYLSNRGQLVPIDGSFSRQFSLDYGVPQGYCLGPLLFFIYTCSLFMVIERHLLQVHRFTDATQLYLSFRADDDDAKRLLSLHVKTGWIFASEVSLKSKF